MMKITVEKVIRAISDEPDGMGKFTQIIDMDGNVIAENEVIVCTEAKAETITELRDTKPELSEYLYSLSLKDDYIKNGPYPDTGGLTYEAWLELKLRKCGYLPT